jgi:hypothetical protein
VKRHHDFEAAGFNFQKVELFDRRTEGPAADLLDDADAMVGVNDFVTDVENGFGADHEVYLEANCVKLREKPGNST